jgi:hypothetical protein
MGVPDNTIKNSIAILNLFRLINCLTLVFSVIVLSTKTFPLLLKYDNISILKVDCKNLKLSRLAILLFYLPNDVMMLINIPKKSSLQKKL